MIHLHRGVFNAGDGVHVVYNVDVHVVFNVGVVAVFNHAQVRDICRSCKNYHVTANQMYNNPPCVTCTIIDVHPTFGKIESF